MKLSEVKILGQKITLLGKPISTQHAYGQRGKIRYMKQEAKQLKEYYIQQVKEQYKADVLECDLVVVIFLHFPDKRRRDWDNYHKISLDSLEGIVFKDDSQIQQATVTKFINKDNPRIEIYIDTY